MMQKVKTNAQLQADIEDLKRLVSDQQATIEEMKHVDRILAQAINRLSQPERDKLNDFVIMVNREKQ